MSRIRVLLVGRHFWPHGSHDSGGWLVQLALGLHRSGVAVEVVTPRYAASWPTKMTFREIPVHRPAAAARSDWSMGRYLRHLGQWLRERGGAYDVIYGDATRDEATAVVEAARAVGRPSVLRVAGWGECGDAAWWPSSRAARRVVGFARMADRTVVGSASTQRHLLSQGFEASRLVRIERGFSPGAPRSATSRAAARKSVATANGDLAASTDTPVILCAGRMTSEAGMNRVAEAAPALVRRFPDLRVWFLGDGPHRESLYTYLRGEGVRASISMPGSFADLQDVLDAADLFVQPGHDGLDSFVPAAVSAELPLVIRDDMAVREAIRVPAGAAIEPLVGWYQGDSAKALRVAIRHAVERLPERRRDAAELRRSLVRAHPLRETIDAYRRLFEELAGRPAADPLRPSTGATR